jgi:hypothetical protein
MQYGGQEVSFTSVPGLKVSGPGTVSRYDDDGALSGYADYRVLYPVGVANGEEY